MMYQGFYLGKWKNHQYEVPENGIHSRSVDDDTVISAAVCAVNYWSEKQGRIVRWVKIKRVNAQSMMGGKLFYLTLKGTDSQFYEAKVYKDFSGNFESRLVRRALFYPSIEAWVLDSFDAPDDSCDDHDAPDDDEFCDDDDAFH
ncbi:hypothetical protein PanWU01x14_261670 [Parasponia andersonii]|uniref:Cystatin domain containing protein n=1 Tax=Parasponia andersonii TaxID=3476 RepID=A0A2P5B8K6_PARAD|nr:hypothetical protein PanWU01x14_261670 [Parasponia andersonii]